MFPKKQIVVLSLIKVSSETEFLLKSAHNAIHCHYVTMQYTVCFKS